MKIIVTDNLNPSDKRTYNSYKEAFEDLAEQLELSIKVKE